MTQFFSIIILFVSLLAFQFSVAQPAFTLNECSNCSEEKYKGYKYSSFYLEMRDGIKIACDLYLPKGLEEEAKIPTILQQTRYVRSMRAKFPLNLLIHPVLASVGEDEIEYFTKRGYAYVVVDVRGTGASFGTRAMEFSIPEIKDGKEVVDWIIAQPWSNKKVGTTGISYAGTTAELLLVNKHPAVRACIPRSNIFDLYNHMVFPGGVRQGPFVKVWQKTTEYLDNNQFAAFGKKAEKYLKGINPVQQDKGGKMLVNAYQQHEENFDVFAELFKVEFRDERHPELNLPLDNFNIQYYRNEVSASRTPIYRIGGWYDGALQRSVIEGFQNITNTERVLLGPWDHGPGTNASPFAKSADRGVDIYLEMLRFFDYHLKGINTGINNEAPFIYYTVGEEKWKSSKLWPIPNQQLFPYFFSDGGKLIKDSNVKEGEAIYHLDSTTTSGNTSRWNSQTELYKNGLTHYNDRTEESKKLLSFTAEPFIEDVVCTGHPVLEMYLSATDKDVTLHCYLEDVAPDGSVTYVTEGQFRAIHRKLSDPELYVTVGPYHSYLKRDAWPLEPGKPALLAFDLHPISYLFRKGHSLRISFAGADLQHFDLEDGVADEFTVHYSKSYLSKITIPFEIKK